MTNLLITDDDVSHAARRMEERTCCVGAPRGPQGIVERVYRGRLASSSIRCKVLMDSGAVRYCDVNDVYCY